MRAAVLLLLVLLAPLAAAHIEDARPVSQLTQIRRTIDIDVDGLDVRVTLLQNGDPLRQWVRHTLEPARGRFGVEHRIDESAEEGRFAVRWDITRIVEYRDTNRNGFFEPEIDTVAKSWPLSSYSWRLLAADQRVSVGGVFARSTIWDANLTGAPALRLEAVTAGDDFTDEGAYTRPQDVLLYLDVLDLPPRGVGSLFAIEGAVRSPAGATARLARVEAAPDVDTGALIDHDRRRALLVWGGEALLDGREQRVSAKLGEPVAAGENETRSLVLSLPILDESMRFVVIDGLEYQSENKRAPLPWAAALGAVALAAWVGRRGRS